MKKITKFLVVALSLALLIGAVVGVSASADDTDGEKWVISSNVSYEENTHLYFAISAALAEDSSLLTVDVLDADGNVLAEGITVSESDEDLYNDGTNVAAHIVKTPGVAAKDMADVLTIKVNYNGEAVDETTYSVAEYFLQRLYKDGLVDATEGKELSQKKLYEASLKYGNAAQKVLAPSDATRVEDLIYVAGAGVDSIWNPNNFLTIPAGTWKVKSYVDGEIVNSVVNGGDYSIENPAVLTDATAPAHTMPEGSTKVEGFTEGDAWAYDTTNDSVLMGYHNHASAENASVYIAPTVGEDEDGTQYVNYLKTGYGTGSSAQTSIVWVKNNDTAGEETLTFETKMRINSISGSFYFRVYEGRTITGPSSGTAFGSDAGRNVAFTSTSIGGVSLGVDTKDWFTLRLVLEGTTLKVYTSNDAGNLVYRGSVDKSAHWEGKDLADITTIILMGDSKALQNIDVAYSYFGKELDYNSVPVEATEYPKTYTGVDATADGWLGSTTIVRDIITCEEIAIFDDIANDGRSDGDGDSGQLVYRFKKNASSDYTVSVSANIKLDYSSLGAHSSTTGAIPEFRLTTNIKHTNRIGFYSSNGIVLMYDYLGSGSLDGASIRTINTGYKLGEWFKITITYTYTPAVAEVVDEETGEITTAAVAASAKTVVTFTTADGQEIVYNATTGAVDEAALDPTTNEIYLNIVPTYDFVGSVGVRNVVFH